MMVGDLNVSESMQTEFVNRPLLEKQIKESTEAAVSAELTPPKFPDASRGCWQMPCSLYARSHRASMCGADAVWLKSSAMSSFAVGNAVAQALYAQSTQGGAQ
jgi:hypothetical protein